VVAGTVSKWGWSYIRCINGIFGRKITKYVSFGKMWVLWLGKLVGMQGSRCGVIPLLNRVGQNHIYTLYMTNFPAKNTVFAPYIRTYVLLWPTLLS